MSVFWVLNVSVLGRVLGHAWVRVLGHAWVRVLGHAWDGYMYRDIAWVGPWQYPAVQYPGYTPPPGYTTAPVLVSAGSAHLASAQRLADSVKTVISGYSIYHMTKRVQRRAHTRHVTLAAHCQNVPSFLIEY